MQRIDENTYIDDTLVTCAEYQLFIDEMREQGKYYQPDHWTSYQFPEGQAREPILGVRYLDAIAFCEWLTDREGDSLWKFRLPYYGEAEGLQIKSNKDFLVGFWALAHNNQDLFSWIGWKPDYTNNFFDNHHGGVDAFEFYRPLELDRNRLQLMAIARQFTRDFDAGIYFVPSRSQAILLSFEALIELREKLYSQNALIGNIDSILRITVNVNYYLNFVLDRSNVLNFVPDDVENETENLLQKSSVIRYVFSMDGSISADPVQQQYSVRTLETLKDITTLYARAEGRSPAFEGIRIVKYREQS